VWGFPGFGRAPARRRLGDVPRFLVESYVASSSDDVDEACARARSTAGAAEGVRYVETTYLPGDDTVLHVFDAPSEEALALAGRSAGLEFERIVPAVQTSGNEREETRR
jgi:hypothetical protein